MIAKAYKDQVKLLLDVLPEVGAHDCFALHGGTAINLFLRDMPRLSVDIDLTYIPIESREESIQNIAHALGQIKGRLEAVIPRVRVTLRAQRSKLEISKDGVQVKVEVNQTKEKCLGQY